MLALRGARDPEAHHAARQLGTDLVTHDGFHLPTTRCAGIDHLRTAYADLHNHAGLYPRAVPPSPATAPEAEPAALPVRYPTESRLVRDMLSSYVVAKACQHQGLTTDAYTRMRRRHVTRGLLLWNTAALALAPADCAAAQAAAQAGHHVRQLDGNARTTEERAHQYLLEPPLLGVLRRVAHLDSPPAGG
ncbi:hypothetical protein AB0N07_39215 [Streptomyces sp. NPDC051172]|uniref:hypothetical protein n=1 Tax=Streptomyces sp. NPDC051172 TaxID=3155796 RepID=UPI00343F66E9